MKNKLYDILIFIFSMFLFAVKIRSFYYLGYFVDEHNTSPDIVFGGDFWLLVEWLSLLVGLTLVFLTAIRVLRSKEEIKGSTTE